MGKLGECRSFFHCLYSVYNDGVLKRHLNPEKLHHAYVITASSLSAGLSYIEKFVAESMNIPFHGNPDVFVGNYATFNIDDLPDVVSMHQRVPMGPKKILVLSANNITAQAQNSLLKMIEEPTPRTHFFICLPTASILLPTVLSRVQVINLRSSEEQSVSEAGEKSDSEKQAQTFLKNSIPDRLVQIKDILADLDKERLTKEDVFQFVSAVLKLAHSKDKRGSNLEVISRVADYMRDPSSSIKMILEYVALRLIV